MKIILRRMKSCALGGDYSNTFFSPLLFFGEGCVLSVTAHLLSKQYQNIMRKYGVTAETTSELDYLCWKHRKSSLKQDSFVDNGKQYHWRKRGVYQIRDKISIVGTTPTFSGDKPKYAEYAKIIIGKCSYIKCMHFTHFGFLKSAFPRNLIVRILNEFLAVHGRHDMSNLKIYWDIDEKFADEMVQLLSEKYSEFNIPDDVVITSEGKLSWRA